jgi:hypothetical protein
VQEVIKIRIVNCDDLILYVHDNMKVIVDFLLIDIKNDLGMLNYCKLEIVHGEN